MMRNDSYQKLYEIVLNVGLGQFADLSRGFLARNRGVHTPMLTMGN